jgi:hypothetical protein
LVATSDKYTAIVCVPEVAYLTHDYGAKEVVVNAEVVTDKPPSDAADEDREVQSGA